MMERVTDGPARLVDAVVVVPIWATPALGAPPTQPATSMPRSASQTSQIALLGARLAFGRPMGLFCTARRVTGLYSGRWAPDTALRVERLARHDLLLVSLLRPFRRLCTGKARLWLSKWLRRRP